MLLKLCCREFAPACGVRSEIESGEYHCINAINNNNSAKEHALRSCVKVEVAILVYLSLIVPTVSVDVKKH